MRAAAHRRPAAEPGPPPGDAVPPLRPILAALSGSRRMKTHELVAEVLRQAITGGLLHAHQALPQQEIAAQLDVSHIPVREALRQLQSEGLVTYQRNRGATVTAHSPEEIRELYEIRAILETAAVRRAAGRLSPGALAAAGQALRRSEQAADPAAWGQAESEFHRILYDLEARPRLAELIESLLRRVDRYWLTQGLMLKHRRRFEAEHRRLLQAVRAGDGEKAVRLLTAHLGGAAELLAESLG